MGTTISGANHSAKGYTVFIDLDRTIINNVSGKVLAVNAIRKGYVKLPELIKILFSYLLYKFRLTDPQNMAEKMIRWTRGMPETIFNELCNESVENTLFPSIYKQALNEIESHRRNNARIILLSASIEQICKRIASGIGIDDVISTSLEVKEGYLTGRAVDTLCFGDVKTARLRDYCSFNSINISESWYYGDSISDLPVFLAIGSPVCINPDRRLKKTALKRGWMILKWSS
jgi:HAD superfamily hydrolase (TIGR01490 family)